MNSINLLLFLSWSFLCMGVLPEYMPIQHVCSAYGRQNIFWYTGSPETGVTDGCEPSCKYRLTAQKRVEGQQGNGLMIVHFKIAHRKDFECCQCKEMITVWADGCANYHDLIMAPCVPLLKCYTVPIDTYNWFKMRIFLRKLCKCDAGGQIQSLVLARQMLYHWATP